MNLATSLGSLGLIGYASWAGRQRTRAVLVSLVAFMAGLMIVHLTTRESNLFELSRTLPDPQNNLGVRISMKRLVREGDLELAEALKTYLIDERSRRAYMAFGNAAFTPLRHSNDTAEFAVKVLGPSLLWYPMAVLVILMVHFSRRGYGALWWGSLLLILVGFLEVAERNFEKILDLQAFPYDTPDDSVQLIRLIATMLFAGLTFLLSYATENKRMDAIETARRVMKLNDVLMKIE